MTTADDGMSPAVNLLLILVLLLPTCASPAAAQAPPAPQLPETTIQHLHDKDWWPTKPDAARKDYVGTQVCATCHKQLVSSQAQTAMANAASRAPETALLRSNPKISFATPPFQTEITRDRKGSSYSVFGGGTAITGQVLWSMGQGKMGQTFVLESSGSLFESQLTWFPAIQSLDLTPGHFAAPPHELEQAFGEKQSPEIAQKCFACHTTAASVRRQFDPTQATPGITCEACHGPGAQHVKGMQNNQPEEGLAAILDPSSFSPVKLVDYCGACHRAPLDVTTAKDFVPINVRFQPYRLSRSRCWSKPDRRITCVACHNPHEPLVQDVDFYDGKCLACHTTRTPGSTLANQAAPVAKIPPVCPVNTAHCVSCHMPKYKVPQMHGSFTDHNIRIVRPTDPYPL